MAKMTLKSLKKKKPLWDMYANFIQIQNQNGALALVSNKVASKDIYKTYFATKPTTVVSGIESFRKKAKMVYEQRLQAVRNDAKKSVSKKVAYASQAKEFDALLKRMQSDRLAYLEGALWDQFKKSNYFTGYVSMHLSGADMRVKLGISSSVTFERKIEAAKMWLLMGNKAKAKKYADEAVAEYVKKKSTQKKSDEPLTTVKLLKDLDKIPISILM